MISLQNKRNAIRTIPIWAGACFLMLVPLFSAAVSESGNAEQICKLTEESRVLLKKIEGDMLFRGYCWQGQVEDTKDVEAHAGKKFTDTTIEINFDGTTQVCSRSVPLQENCLPKRGGGIEICEHFSGERKCQKMLKKNAGKIDISSIVREANDPDIVDDTLTRNLTSKIKRDILDQYGGGRFNSFRDDDGLLVPFFEGESGRPDEKRVVSLPYDTAQQILGDSAFEDRIRTWVDENHPHTPDTLGRSVEVPVTSQVSEPYDFGLRYREWTDTQISVSRYDPHTPDFNMYKDSTPLLPWPKQAPTVPVPNARENPVFNFAYPKMNISYNSLKPSPFVRNSRVVETSRNEPSTLQKVWFSFRSWLRI